jgi:hypothetical protein
MTANIIQTAKQMVKASVLPPSTDHWSYLFEDIARSFWVDGKIRAGPQRHYSPDGFWGAAKGEAGDCWKVYDGCKRLVLSN